MWRCSEYARSQLHVDLSQCTHWIRMMEIWYKRSETSRGEKCDYQEITVVFMPDIWSGSPVIPSLLQGIQKKEEVKEEMKEEVKEEMKEEVKEEKKEEVKKEEMTEEMNEEEKENEEEEESTPMCREGLMMLRVVDLRAAAESRTHHWRWLMEEVSRVGKQEGPD